MEEVVVEEERATIRCPHCDLMQFASWKCRRCHKSLVTAREMAQTSAEVRPEELTPEEVPFHTQITKQISLRILRLRKAKKMSQQRLADSIDSQRSYISKLENRKLEPKIATLNRLALAFGVNVTYFIVGEKDRREQVLLNDPFICELIREGKGLTAHQWEKVAERAKALA